MRAMMKMLLVAALVAANAPLPAQTLSPSQVFEKAAPSVVTVHALGTDRAERMQGSGVVTGAGVVVSNCHVLEPGSSFEVGSGGTRFKATIRHADPERDLCSLAVPGLRAPPANRGASTSLPIGSEVYAIGAPRGLSLSLSNGLLSARRDALLQVTAPVSPGSSGGGLFDAQGRLIGITTLYLKDSQQLNFAIPVEWIAALPTRNRGALSIVDPKSVGAEQLNEWEKLVSQRDSNYTPLRPELVKQVAVIKQRFPPEQWLWETQKAYEALTASTSTVYRCGGSGGRQYTTRHLAGQECASVYTYQTEPGSRWHSIGESDGTQLAIDTETISKSPDGGSAWLRLSEPSGETTYVLHSIHCPTARYRIVEEAIRDASGKSKTTLRIDGAWERVVPDSVGEAIVQSVCNGR